jgi:hypothetical protein
MELPERSSSELVLWLFRGATLGLLILGIGGRALMRVVAHMEHRPQLVLTVGGTLTVIFAGTVAGLIAGLIYYLIRRFVNNGWLRTVLFMVIVELISWRGVSGLLPIPQLLFMTLALIYIVIIDLLGRRTAVPAR